MKMASLLEWSSFSDGQLTTWKNILISSSVIDNYCELEMRNGHFLFDYLHLEIHHE